jgi:hypothetical protein
MAFCDNVFCTHQVKDSESVSLAGRKFCCAACAEDWYRQNEALAEPAMHDGQAAAGPSPEFREDSSSGAGATFRAPRSAA